MPGREHAPPFPPVREDGMQAPRSHRLSATLPAPGPHPPARGIEAYVVNGGVMDLKFRDSLTEMDSRFRGNDGQRKSNASR